jgi:hypothetical protein
MNTPFNITIPAGSCANDSTGGKALTILKTTLPFNVSFNGGANVSATQGAGYTPPGGITNVLFTNPNAVAITVTYAIGDEVAKYTPADNSTAGATVYALGNCGIANSSNGNFPDYNGSTDSITVDGNGYMAIGGTINAKISGTNNGHRRQMIIFSIASVATSAFALNVCDSNLNTLITIPAGSPPMALPFDGDLYVSGAGGTAKVTIGQFFLNS